MTDEQSVGVNSGVLPKCYCNWKHCRTYQKTFRDSDHAVWNGVVRFRWEANIKSSEGGGVVGGGAAAAASASAAADENPLKAAFDTILGVDEAKHGDRRYTVAKHHFAQPMMLKLQAHPKKWDWTKPLKNKREAKKLLYALEKKYSFKNDGGETLYYKVPNVTKDYVKEIVKQINEEKKDDDATVPTTIGDDDSATASANEDDANTAASKSPPDTTTTTTTATNNNTPKVADSPKNESPPQTTVSPPLLQKSSGRHGDSDDGPRRPVAMDENDERQQIRAPQPHTSNGDAARSSSPPSRPGLTRPGLMGAFAKGRETRSGRSLSPFRGNSSGDQLGSNRSVGRVGSSGLTAIGGTSGRSLGVDRGRGSNRSLSPYRGTSGRVASTRLMDRVKYGEPGSLEIDLDGDSDNKDENRIQPPQPNGAGRCVSSKRDKRGRMGGDEDGPIRPSPTADAPLQRKSGGGDDDGPIRPPQPGGGASRHEGDDDQPIRQPQPGSGASRHGGDDDRPIRPPQPGGSRMGADNDNPILPPRPGEEAPSAISPKMDRTVRPGGDDDEPVRPPQPGDEPRSQLAAGPKPPSFRRGGEDDDEPILPFAPKGFAIEEPEQIQVPLLQSRMQRRVTSGINSMTAAKVQEDPEKKERFRQITESESQIRFVAQESDRKVASRHGETEDGLLSLPSARGAVTALSKAPPPRRESEEKEESLQSMMGSSRPSNGRRSRRQSRVSIVADSTKFTMDKDYRVLVNERVGLLEINKQQQHTLLALIKQVEALKSDIRVYQEHEEQKDDDIIELEFQLQGSEAAIQREVNLATKPIRFEIQDMRRELQGVIDELSKRISELEGEKSRLEKDMQDVLVREGEKDQSIANFTDQLDKGRKAAEESDAILQKELEDVRSNLTVAQSELAKLDGENKANLDNLKVTLQQQEEAAAESEQFLRMELEDQLSSLEETHNTLQQQLAEERTKVESTANDLSESQDCASQFKNEMAELKGSMDKDSQNAGEEIIELKRAIEDLTAQNDSTKAAIQAITEHRDEGLEREAQHMEKICALEHKAQEEEEMKSLLDEMRGTQASLVDEKSQLTQERDQLSEREKYLEDRVSELESKLQDSLGDGKAREAGLEKKLADQKSMIESLEKDLAESIGQHESRTRSIDELSAANNAENQRSVAEILELRQQIEDLNVKVGSSEEEKNSAIDERDYLSITGQERVGLIESLEKQLADSRPTPHISESTRSIGSTDNLEAVIEDLQKEMKQMELLGQKMAERDLTNVEMIQELEDRLENTDFTGEKEKKMRLEMDWYRDRQATVTAHAYFAKKALKKMGPNVDDIRDLYYNAGTQANLMRSALEKTESGRGWGLLSEFVGSSVQDVAAIEREDMGILDDTLDEEVIFEEKMKSTKGLFGFLN